MWRQGRGQNGHLAGGHPDTFGGRRRPRPAASRPGEGRARPERRQGAGRDRTAGNPRERAAAVCRRSQRADPVRALPRGRLALVAGGPARRALLPPRQPRLPEPEPPHVRRLPGGARMRLGAAGTGAGGRDRGRARGPAAGTAARIPGRVRIPRLRPSGCPARARPLLPHPGRSARGRDLPIRGMAVQALPLRSPVHPRQLRARPAGPGRRAVGAEGDRGARQPRGDRPRRLRRSRAGAPVEVGGGVRGAEPGAARAGGGRGPQRHARDGLAGGRAGAGSTRSGAGAGGRAGGWTGGRPSSWRFPGRGGGHPRGCVAGRWQQRRPARERGRGGRRHGREDHRRRGAAVRGARPAAVAGAGHRAGGRGAGPGGPRRAGTDRLRLAHARVPRRRRRAAATGGHPQRAGRDGPPGRPLGHADLVAAPVPGGLLRGARADDVAHRPRLGLARDGRLGDARAARVDRLAAAVVRDLAAAASGPRRGPAAVCRHAAVLRLRDPDPPAAG